MYFYESTFFRNLNEFRFAMDVVGTVGFGLDVNSVENEDEPFREIEKLVNNGEIINRLRLIGAFFCPT